MKSYVFSQDPDGELKGHGDNWVPLRYYIAGEVDVEIKTFKDKVTALCVEVERLKAEARVPRDQLTRQRASDYHGHPDCQAVRIKNAEPAKTYSKGSSYWDVSKKGDNVAHS